MSNEQNASEVFKSESHGEKEEHHTPGTMVLTLILLVSFAVYYFANWKALADVWPVR